MSRCGIAPSKPSYDSGYDSAVLEKSDTNYVGTCTGDGCISEIPSWSPPVRPFLGLYQANPLTSLRCDYGLPPKRIQKWDDAPMEDINFDIGDERQLNDSSRNLLSFSDSGRSSFQPVVACLIIPSGFRYTL